MNVEEKAVAMWSAFDDNEKTGIRFGMFPAVKMREAEKEGFNGRQLVCALMDCASKHGGMRA
jgi:hypothetical protein